MARYARREVYAKMEETGVVPVFYHSDPEITKKVVKACYEGGIRAFEYTNRGDYAHKLFEELNRWAEKECPEMILGAGTVLDGATAALYMQAGANFIVSPLLNPETVKVCNRRQTACIPGCATVSEISQAQELGAEIIKVFPGDVLTPSFIKGLKAPMPWSRLMVTGGVEPNEGNLREWINAGACCVGMGSKLFPKETIEKEEWGKIRDLSRICLETVKRLKSGKN